MSDLYKTIAKIEALEKTSNAEQKTFAQNLLNLNGNALRNFKKNRNIGIEVIDEVITHLRTKINETDWKSPLFKRKLNKILKNFEAAKQKIQVPPKTLQFYARVHDVIYQEVEKYNGTLIAPINQALDPRLASAHGECYGFVLAWVKALLNKQKPFGIDPDSAPLFHPVKYDSKAGKANPDLNTLVVITEEISKFQKNKKVLTLEEKISKTRKTAQFEKYSDAAHLAQHMLRLINENPKTVLYLNMIFHGGAKHALGFHKDDKGRVHFLDANAGWFRFNNERDFSNWLPAYFNKIGYNRMSHYYRVSAFASDKELKQAAEVKVEAAAGKEKQPTKQYAKDDVELARSKEKQADSDKWNYSDSSGLIRLFQRDKRVTKTPKQDESTEKKLEQKR